MYSTCLHCQRALGTNEFIETFPVGRRVAFDAQQGRLWAVCRRCERWNLAPIDRRWEAIEECERAYRSTRVRVSSGNIGLSRVRDGTELVRIGKPLRPEFAAWRYGDQFGRRRRRAAVLGTGVAGAAGLAAAGMITASAGLVAFLPIVQLVNMAVILSVHGVHLKPMVNPEGGYFRPAGRPKLVERPDVEEGWGIEVGYTALAATKNGFFSSLRGSNNTEIGRLQIPGNAATPILRRVLPAVNRGGASRKLVAEGVQLIEQAGDAASFGKWAARQRRAWGTRQLFGDTGDLAHIPASARLAFEMAIFEDDERRAMLGELARLEEAWRDAEEIASIADSLHVPAVVEARYDELRRRSGQS